MPETHETNRRSIPNGEPEALAPGVPAPGVRAANSPPYVELHCKTNFSFLEGASHPDELVTRAIELGYRGLAITDRNSLAGVVRAYAGARQALAEQPGDFRLIIGAEITPVDAAPVVLWASDRASYGRLARLITVGRRAAEKGSCRITFDDIANHAEGLLAGVLPPTGTPFAKSSADELARATAQYRQLFGDRTYLLAELCLGCDDERRLEELLHISRQCHVPLATAGDVHYHCPSRLPLSQVLTAIRRRTTVAELAGDLHANAERHLQPRDELARRFARAPQALARTVEILERTRFCLSELRYEYPEELVPVDISSGGQTPGANAYGSPLGYLTQLTWQGARQRYPQGIPAKVQQLLQHELQLIGELHYEAYFLTVYDLVRFARERGILCQGRGSAANSVVCYCLGVTSVDPQQIEVLFERFVSKERNEAPDIDIDFEHSRREEVLQYLYDKYGRDRVGMTAEVITYRPRSAVREVGKALGLSLDRVDALAKNLEGYRSEPLLAQRAAESGLDPASPVVRQLLALVAQLLGFPRHLGQHVGGMVMTQGPLCELVPLENAAMPGRTVIEWDKNDLDELGILKVDILSLGMLTAIRKSFELIAQHTGQHYTLANVPAEDPAVYDMICRADTMGVFQIESRAQMSMLPRLRPREFYDLVIEVAIVRPGPIQGNMVHPYLRRRAGLEPVTFPNDAIRQVLGKTLGVPLFQEQAMRLAVVAAGFTPGEADQLRRAMGAWRKTGVIEKFRKKLIDGMVSRGLSAEFAERVFLQIRGFGEYGFPESHAASFALLVYVSCWLKHYHIAAFTAALINSQPMGFYAPAQLVRNAREHGVTVREVDVNHSQWDCTLEADGVGSEIRGENLTIENNSTANLTPDPLALRLGMRLIKGLSEVHAQQVTQARLQGPFVSWEDFTRRVQLPAAALRTLSQADAFGSLRLSRRQALWQSLACDRTANDLPLFANHVDDEPIPLSLPRMSAPDQVLADYGTVGMSLKAHPISFARQQLQRQKVLPAGQLAALRDSRMVRVAGLVLVRQRPGTAKGITFMTLEDETGVANLVIKQDVWNRFRRPARQAVALVAHGRLQNRQGVVHVVVSRLEDLSEWLTGLDSQSRDFH
jgi:error-prone DNA polymerase